MAIQIIIFVIALILLYKFGTIISTGIIRHFSGGSVFSKTELHGVQELFFKTVFQLLGYVARRDGRINEKEIKRTETYMEKMALDTQHRHEAIRLFKLGAAPGFDVNRVIAEFQGLAHKSPNLTQILLVYLISLARTDGALVNKEVDAVQEIANGLGQSTVTFEHLLKMISSQHKFNDEPIIKDSDFPSEESGRQEGFHEKGRGDDTQKDSRATNENNQSKSWRFNSEDERNMCAYDALGLTPSASDAEVKKAYRTFASQYHPDKLMGQGLPEFMIKDATERFKKIQSAYDCIIKSRKH